MLRVDALLPNPRMKIENPCVGGSIPPQATSIEAPLCFASGAFFMAEWAWWGWLVRLDVRSKAVSCATRCQGRLQAQENVDHQMNCLWIAECNNMIREKRGSTYLLFDWATPRGEG